MKARDWSQELREALEREMAQRRTLERHAEVSRVIEGERLFARFVEEQQHRDRLMRELGRADIIAQMQKATEANRTFSDAMSRLEEQVRMFGNASHHRMWSNDDALMWKDSAQPVEQIKINVNDSVKVEEPKGVDIQVPTARIIGKAALRFKGRGEARITMAGALIKPALQKPIAMPSGQRMERITDVLFFFARKKPRALEEVLDDYRFEMISAEAKGASERDLRVLRVKHWGGYFIALADVAITGIVGKIVGIIAAVWKRS